MPVIMPVLRSRDVNQAGAIWAVDPHYGQTMRRFVAVPAIAAVVAPLWSVSVANAFQNEPNGFQGIAWGTPFSAVQNQMIRMPGEGSEGTQLYNRKSDKLMIGGAAFQEVAYVFENGVFLGAIVMTKGRENRQAIISAFKAQFGEASKPVESMDDYYWWGNTASINLSCELLADECAGIIRSTVGLKQDLADTKTQ